jgi:transposase-like protein
MGREHRKFTADFKAEAVQLVASSGGSVAHVARDLGINEGTLGNWVLRWKQDHAGDVEEEPLTPTERAELARLRKENATLRMERELLKKYAAFCVTEMNR